MGNKTSHAHHARKRTYENAAQQQKNQYADHKVSSGKGMSLLHTALDSPAAAAAPVAKPAATQHADKQQPQEIPLNQDRRVKFGETREYCDNDDCDIVPSLRKGASQVSYVDTMYARAPGHEAPKKWTPEQDAALRLAVENNGAKKWKTIAEQVPGRNHVQCLQRWKKVLKPGLVKGHWTEEEDNKLLELVQHKELSNWAMIAANIEGRTAKQCRERWGLNLDPTINRGPWSTQEDELLLKLQAEKGNRWAELSQYLPGRTENAVKTRFKSLERSRARQWTPEEDAKLIKARAKLGRRWGAIQQLIPSRSKNAIKVRWKFLVENNPELNRLYGNQSSGSSRGAQTELPTPRRKGQSKRAQATLLSRKRQKGLTQKTASMAVLEDLVTAERDAPVGAYCFLPTSTTQPATYPKSEVSTKLSVASYGDMDMSSNSLFGAVQAPEEPPSSASPALISGSHLRPAKHTAMPSRSKFGSSTMDMFDAFSNEPSTDFFNMDSLDDLGKLKSMYASTPIPSPHNLQRTFSDPSTSPASKENTNQQIPAFPEVKLPVRTLSSGSFTAPLSLKRTSSDGSLSSLLNCLPRANSSGSLVGNLIRRGSSSGVNFENVFDNDSVSTVDADFTMI